MALDLDRYYREAAIHSGLYTGGTYDSEEIESKGPLHWLQTLFPSAFGDAFSKDHERFWELWWSLLQRIKRQKSLAPGEPVPEEFRIDDAEWTIMLLLGRGLGKSSSIEASSVMRGAVLGGGYCLYLCESQDQANEHLGNIKGLIEHPDSRLVQYYPGMALADVATIENVRARDRADLFICGNGWIARAKGLDAKLRGIRIGDRRPDDINIDDIDDVTDSVAVSLNKLRRLTASVLPTQARRFATKKIGQNLIIETGVINQIYTGKSDAFAERTTIGVSNTFEEFTEGEHYESFLDPNDGRLRHKILPAAKPTWAGVDRGAAQNFLNDSGLDVFLAEYQNQFQHLRTGRVFHAYDEARHVITWSEFEKLFRSRSIPAHWQCKAAADIGYSRESISAWAFIAASAQNSPLPNHYFLYRGLTFTQTSIDTQAEAIWEHLFPDPATGKRHFEARTTFTDYSELFRLLSLRPRCKKYLENFTLNPLRNRMEGNFPDDGQRSVADAARAFRSQVGWIQISHEKSGEQKTLAQKYGLPVQKTRHFGAEDGVTEANHLLAGDRTTPHPFLPDEQDEATGLWTLGRPYLYFIVDDDQREVPRDDRGLKTFRQHIAEQRWTEEKFGEHGLTRAVPLKYRSDCGDALRIWAADYATPRSTPLTVEEEFDVLLPPDVRPQAAPDGSYDFDRAQQQEYEFKRALAEDELRRRHGLTDDDDEEDWDYL